MVVRRRRASKVAAGVALKRSDAFGNAGTTLPETWAKLAEFFGGVGKLAGVIGCSPGTVHRWGHGTTTIPAADRKLVRVLAVVADVQSPV